MHILILAHFVATEHGCSGSEWSQTGERGYVPIKSLANKVGVTKLQHIAAGTAPEAN